MMLTPWMALRLHLGVASTRQGMQTSKPCAKRSLMLRRPSTCLWKRQRVAAYAPSANLQFKFLQFKNCFA